MIASGPRRVNVEPIKWRLRQVSRVASVATRRLGKVEQVAEVAVQASDRLLGG